MENTQVQAIPRKAILTLIQLIAFVGIAALAPLFPMQGLTGPIVNALLYIAVVMLGVQNAIIVGLLPSTIALSAGLLPAVLAPMIPFIIIGNVILVITFNYFYQRNFWSGVIMASIFKFVFLYATSNIVVGLLLKSELATQVSAMMNWPQLATALGGGVIAWAFLKSIKRI